MRMAKRQRFCTVLRFRLLICDWVMQGLELGRHIGSGSFSNVFLGKWRNQTVAVKVWLQLPPNMANKHAVSCIG